MAKFEISINASMASDVAIKKAAEIRKAEQKRHYEAVQGIINVVTRHVGEAMEKGEFSIKLSIKELKDNTDESIISSALSDYNNNNENKKIVAGTKEDIDKAIYVLEREGGFNISKWYTDHKPYFSVQWPLLLDDDDDSTK